MRKHRDPRTQSRSGLLELAGGSLAPYQQAQLTTGPDSIIQVAKMNKDAQMRAAINQKLIETGERERLKELLRAKLIECGWKDQLKAHCKDVIKEKGLEHVTVDDLVAEITPKGRALVPDSVKKELLQRIRTFLAQHASL